MPNEVAQNRILLLLLDLLLLLPPSSKIDSSEKPPCTLLITVTKTRLGALQAKMCGTGCILHYCATDEQSDRYKTMYAIVLCRKRLRYREFDESLYPGTIDRSARHRKAFERFVQNTGAWYAWDGPKRREGGTRTDIKGRESRLAPDATSVPALSPCVRRTATQGCHLLA
jgi:hypothetical protein